MRQRPNIEFESEVTRYDLLNALTLASLDAVHQFLHVTIGVVRFPSIPMPPPVIQNRKIVAIPKFSAAVGDQMDVLFGLVNACT